MYADDRLEFAGQEVRISEFFGQADRSGHVERSSVGQCECSSVRSDTGLQHQDHRLARQGCDAGVFHRIDRQPGAGQQIELHVGDSDAPAV